MISFGRLLLGLVVPVLLLLSVWLPACTVVRVEPVDWQRRHERALADARGEGHGLMALARSFRAVPDELRPFVEEQTAGRLIAVRGSDWGRVADGVWRTAQGDAPDREWASRRGRAGSLYENALFFGVDEAPFAALPRHGDEFDPGSGSFVYLSIEGPAQGQQPRYLGLTLLSLGDVYAAAPLRLLFPWRRFWPLAFGAAVALFLGVVWPVWPRRAGPPQAACPTCGKPVVPGARFCGGCGASVIAAVPAVARTLAWEVRVPLLRNPLFLGDGARFVAIVSAAMLALMAGIALASRNGPLLPLLTMTLLVVGGVTLLGVAIAVVLDLVGHTELVRLDEQGALVSTSRTARAIGKAAAAANVVGGLIAGRPGNVGAGLIAGSTLDRSMTWADVRAVLWYPACHVIELRESWPAPCRLNCGDAATYATAASLVVERVLMAGGTLSRRPSLVGRLFRAVVFAILAATLAYLLFA